MTDETIGATPPAGTARAMATTEQVGRQLAQVVEQISRIYDS